jgi:UDP-2-acetamido-3-amino-2,3-dideoxy-glucuronate N-acetyltransferase
LLESTKIIDLIPESVKIGKYVSVEDNVSIGENTKVWNFVDIMRDVVIGRDCVIGPQTIIQRGAVIGDGTHVMNQCEICFDARIGKRNFIAPNFMMTNDWFPPSGRWQAGSTGDDVILLVRSCLMPGVHVGDWAVLSDHSVAKQDIPEGEWWAGNPARKYSTRKMYDAMQEEWKK